MQSRLVRALPAFALVLAFAAALVAGCSSSSNSTAPPPNNVVGPTFSLAFPAAGTPASPGTSNRLFFHGADVGSWNYHCIPHQSLGMVGTINVTVGAAESALVLVGVDDSPQHNAAFHFSPATVTIDTGGYVRWANASSMTIHTATR
jgi:plastocyanin